MRIAVVTAHHAPDRVHATLRSLRPLLRSLGSPRVVAVANSADAERTLGGAGGDAGPLDVLRHDNSGYEFGAFQRGLDACASGDPNWIVFANDTFSVHQVFPQAYLDHAAAHLRRDVDHPVLAGQIEQLPRSYVLEGVRTHRWVTTNFFALNRAALTALGGRLHVPAVDAHVAETARRADFLSPALDPVLRGHLEEWLFGERGSPSAWYGAAPLDEANVGTMVRKARSILQEKRISAVLDGASAEFASIRELPFLQDLLLRIRRRGRRAVAPAATA